MTSAITHRLIVGAAFSALLSAFALPAAAGPIVVDAASSGKLDITTKTVVSALNSPIKAGVYARADGVDGAKAAVDTSDPNYKIKAINLVKLLNPLQNVFGYPGWGLVPVPKFPGGNPTCGFIRTENIGPITDSFASSN